MKRPDKTTRSQNEKATPPAQSSETDSPQSKYILKSLQLTPQEWQGVMKRLRKEGTAEELLQIVRISIPLSQNYTPEERTEATHFFANELMKLAREGKVIKPPSLRRL